MYIPWRWGLTLLAGVFVSCTLPPQDVAGALSFIPGHKLKPGHNPCPCALQAAAAMWEAIRSGAAEQDPALLQRLVLLTFCDLKHYKFFYWCGGGSQAAVRTGWRGCCRLLLLLQTWERG